MNGPATLYRLKPVFKIPQKLELPDCMYKLKNPVASVTNQIDEKDEEILTGVMDKEPLPELASIEAKWDGIIQQLTLLKLQLADIRKTVGVACKLTGYTLVDTATLDKLKVFQEAVINASPSNPPYFLLLVKHLYKSTIPIIFKSHIHSSLPLLSLPDHLKCFDEPENSVFSNSLNLHIVWKNELLDTEIVLNPVKQIPIKGEVNILKLFAHYGLNKLHYPTDDILTTTLIDSVLDVCHRLVHSQVAKERSSLCRMLSRNLGKMTYFGGNDINIVDVSAWSILKTSYESVRQDLSPNLLKWYKNIDEIDMV